MQRINDVFERVVVVNLDRRHDRMATLAKQLDRFAIAFERFRAIDARDPKVEAEWRAYAEGPLTTLPDGQRPVTNYREFYLDYDSDQARAAFLEAKTGCKAIATAGAWALLATLTALAERALNQCWESVLVLEDDALLHRDTPELFDRVMMQVPSDWRVLQLGTMQLHWEEDWIEWYSYNLYRCRGSSIASHAFALRGEAIQALLDACRKRELPFDLGALHSVKRRFAEHSFTVFPNLVIQDAADSDIGMSTIFFREAHKLDNIYRWHLPSYGLAAIEARLARETACAAAPNQEGPELKPVVQKPRSYRPGWWAGLRRSARAWPWRRDAIAAKTATAAEAKSLPERAARTKPTAPRSPSGLKPLTAWSNQHPKPRTVAAVVVGLESSALMRVVDLLRTDRDTHDVEPIVVTDCDEFELFRDSGLVFEYLPILAERKRLAPELDWELHLLRRLALIRRKWRPGRIVAFGPAATQLLLQWKDSPFEDDSIHRVAAATPMTEIP
jgi:GR25 family glycosyltransferase involved in LPS biosynthesis